MKKAMTRAFCAAMIFAGSAAAEEGFTPIFDGESLEGWRASADNPDSFLVENGALVARGGPAHLFYDGPVGGADFRNFELRLKVMTTPGSNSGVYFHTAYQEGGWPAKGYEAQVNSTQSDPRKTGSLYGVVDMYVPRANEEPFIARSDGVNVAVARDAAPSVDGEWFDYAVRVEHRTITIKVNGMTTVQWTEPSDWASRDFAGRALGSGAIALQAHDPDSEVRYKDIRIKLLD